MLSRDLSQLPLWMQRVKKHQHSLRMSSGDLDFSCDAIRPNQSLLAKLEYLGGYDFFAGFQSLLVYMVDDSIEKNRHQIGVKTQKKVGGGSGGEDISQNGLSALWSLFLSNDEEWIFTLSVELLARSQKLQRDIPISDLADYPLKYKSDVSPSEALRVFNNYLNDVSRWVEVVTLCSWDAGERAKCVSFVVSLLGMCREMKNYHVCLGLMMGLLSPHVQRYYLMLSHALSLSCSLSLSLSLSLLLFHSYYPPMLYLMNFSWYLQSEGHVGTSPA